MGKNGCDLTAYINAMSGAGNLNEYEATTLVYYCVMTWHKGFEIIPIINLTGESGTGKSGIMKQIEPWCNGAKRFSAEGMTEAQLRDVMADVTTVFVDEADKTKDQEACERWYKKRQEVINRECSYRRQTLNKKEHQVNVMEPHNHFGFTVLHTQEPLITGQMVRRCLGITVYKNNDREYSRTDGLPNGPIMKLATKVDWSIKLPSSTAWDAWVPFYRIGMYLKNEKYCEYVEEQVKNKLEEDNQSSVFEPKGIVFSEIASLYYGEPAEVPTVHTYRKRIPLTEIRDRMWHRGYSYIERQIAGFAKEMGFKIVLPHNKAHVCIECEDQLKEIARKINATLEC